MDWITARKRTRTCLLALSLPVLCAACAHAFVQPTGDASLDKTIRAMGNASTWGHPDEFGQFTGMRAYASGNYASAMQQFKRGAWYADKLSQLSIGLMYLNGKGVAKDPIKAYAWIAIAAERGYPQFIATRDQLWTTLDASQRDAAKKTTTALYASYGDPSAKPRMAHQLEWARMQITGSLAGYVDPSMLHVATQQNCSGSQSGVPTAGCGGDTYAAWRMDPKKYFRAKDAGWKFSVSVGSLVDLHSTDSKLFPNKSAHADVPAAAGSR